MQSKLRLTLFSTVFLAALLGGAHARAGEASAPPELTLAEPARWEFTISSPGFLAGLDGTIGINGLEADVDLGFDQILENLDMVFALRLEARKGRFGVYGELIYLSISDGAQLRGRLINNVALQVDEYLADAGASWRLVDRPTFTLDVVAGTRYTNLYQRLEITANTPVIEATSEQFVAAISEGLRDRLNDAISESAFISDLQNTIATRISDQLIANLREEQRSPSVPIAPLAGRHPEAIARVVENVVLGEEARIRAEIDALGLIGAAREAAVQERVAERQEAISQQIATNLQRRLNRSFARADYWFDPYLGLRGRYNITKAVYTSASAEIGGFGIGSDLMWQVQGAVGVNLTRHIFSEVGYRALSFCYENDGLKFDTVTHGPQITAGIRF